MYFNRHAPGMNGVPPEKSQISMFKAKYRVDGAYDIVYLLPRIFNIANSIVLIILIQNFRLLAYNIIHRVAVQIRSLATKIAN